MTQIVNMAGRPRTRARLLAEEAARKARVALYEASLPPTPEEPALPVPADEEQASQMTREELSRRSPGIARRLCRCAMGELTLTFQEIQASKLILDKLVASAVQRVDLRASVEVRDKRATIEALITALSRPGAVGRGPDGAPVLNLPATVTEARLARADGKGPPELDATGMPIQSDEPTR